MSLIVEDGTGLPNSESYISASSADDYHTKRGNAAWAALDAAAKEAFLRRGTEYIDAVYTFKGHRLTDAQALAWPRDVEGVPLAVQRATAELALRAINGDLMPDAGPQVKSETVGPISVTYMDGASSFTSFSAVNSILASLLDESAYGQARVIRS